MTPEERAQRMLERLPLVLQGGPKLRQLFEAMGLELDVMERATRRLLESRWYTLARGFEVGDELADKAASDLGSIGALFDLRPGRGESVAYFRRHIAELVRIHSRGLSTARALLQLVSVAYLAQQPPEIEVKDGLAVGLFTVPGAAGKIRVEIADNPPSPASARILGAEANQDVLTYNAGLDEAFPAIDIKASSGDVTVPLLHQEESGLDIILLDTIKAGQTLALRHGLPPRLDGDTRDGLVLVANPTRFAARSTDDRVFRFDTPEARFSLCEPSNKLPPLSPGESRWRYRTLSRAELHAYIGGRVDVARHVTRALEKATSPPVDITFRWTEVTPAAFELRIPASYVPPHHEGDLLAFLRDIHAALAYGRSAGVRATVGVVLPLDPEVVSIEERPLGMTVEVSFAEAQASADRLAAVGPTIELEERLPPPEERFTIGGIHDVTRFDGSRFQ
jgi:hypothetical protein